MDLMERVRADGPSAFRRAAVRSAPVDTPFQLWPRAESAADPGLGHSGTTILGSSSSQATRACSGWAEAVRIL